MAWQRADGNFGPWKHFQKGRYMKKATLFWGILLACSPLVARAAGPYAGEWSYQALNAGDTNFKVEQDGRKVTFYRVLHPEFEGERYKLEHMYRGELSGKRIKGKLFVREEGMSDFDYLRAFDGKIKSRDRMIVDEMPLKRVGGKTMTEVEPPPAEEEPESRYSKVVINREGTGSGEKPGEAKKEKAQAAPREIPKLIPVARRLQTKKARRVRKTIDEADVMFDEKKYAPAVERYERALELDPHKVEVLYKLGVGHGTLAVLATRKGEKVEARTHLEDAIRFWSRAVRYDPYNWGAKENIKRARKKLEDL